MRTFIAVPISAQVRAQATHLIGRLASSGASVKWVEPENLHFTLKFLGEVDNQATAEVCLRVTEAVADLAPFDVTIQGAGAFPRSSRPRTIWLGVAEGQQELATIHRAIETALLPMGFHCEQRRFVPHLTIGRVRAAGRPDGRLAALIDQNVSFRGGGMSVEEVVVMASFLDRAGPTYQALGRAALGGGV